MNTIGILGSGVVGVTLANGFKKHGYEAVIGVRDKKEVKDWSGPVSTFLDVLLW